MFSPSLLFPRLRVPPLPAKHTHPVQMMRRSSDPEVRRSASAAVSIESLDETAARDVIVTKDGVQQIVPASSLQSLRSNAAAASSSSANGDVGSGNGHLLNGVDAKAAAIAGKDAVELVPLTGGSVATVRNRKSFSKSVPGAGKTVLDCPFRFLRFRSQ